jgi:hypothetical protein
VEDKFEGARLKAGADGVAQVVECLPSKHETLNSNPGTTKKKTEGRRPARRLLELCKSHEGDLDEDIRQ